MEEINIAEKISKLTGCVREYLLKDKEFLKAIEDLKEVVPAHVYKGMLMNNIFVYFCAETRMLDLKYVSSSDYLDFMIASHHLSEEEFNSYFYEKEVFLKEITKRINIKTLCAVKSFKVKILEEEIKRRQGEISVLENICAEDKYENHTIHTLKKLKVEELNMKMREISFLKR